MSDFIFIGSFFCCLIVSYLLLFRKNYYHSFSDKVLASLFICYAYCTAAYLLVTSGWLIYFPYTYKTAQPISYLVPPLAYIYVRSILQNEKSFYKIDSLHFIPFIFFTINYFPLYFLNSEEKLLIVKDVINNVSYNFSKKDGIFSEGFQIFRPIQACTYILLQWRLISSFQNKYQELLKDAHTVSILSWVKKFTTAISLTIISYVFLVIILLYGLENVLIINKIIFYSSIPVALSLFYLSSYLVINPSVLAGLPYLNYVTHSKTNTITALKYEEDAKLILKYFEEKKPYLKRSISINEISLDIDIPLKMVSFVINNHFKLNFNDFVNQYRIEAIVQRITNGDLERYTLSSLFQEAGFSNKTTFLSAFKKVHHCTPTEFIQT